MGARKARLVKAAGGVVVRTGDDGAHQVLLVHRPGYDDWTFPKGKADPGERWRETALREVREETGYRCRLGRKLGVIRYVDRKGRRKKVRYWSMTVERGQFEPNDEVDAIRWCSIDEAAALLSYERDVPLLESLAVPVAA